MLIIPPIVVTKEMMTFETPLDVFKGENKETPFV